MRLWHYLDAACRCFGRCSDAITILTGRCIGMLDLCQTLRGLDAELVQRGAVGSCLSGFT